MMDYLKDEQEIVGRYPKGSEYFQKWKLNPALRAEFNSFGAYAAFENAMERGLVRIMGKTG